MSVKTERIIKFNGTESEPIYLEAGVLAGIEIGDDSSFDNKTLSLKVSSSNGSFKDLYDSDGVKFPLLDIGKNRHIYFELPMTTAVKYAKFISNSSLDGKQILAFIYRDN